MLTEQRLKKLEGFNENYIIRQEEVMELVSEVRTLQLHRNELIEGVQAAIRWLEGEHGVSIRSKQLRMLLEYVEGDTP